MAHPMGEAKQGPLRVGFDRRLKLEFHGSKVTSDAGLLPYRELDEAVGLSALAGDVLSEARRGKNTRHLLTGLLRQSVYGRLAGYEDVNDAERLSRDPVMRAIVDHRGLDGSAASSSQIERFETAWLASDDNLAALIPDAPFARRCAGHRGREGHAYDDQGGRFRLQLYVSCRTGLPCRHQRMALALHRPPSSTGRGHARADPGPSRVADAGAPTAAGAARGRPRHPHPQCTSGLRGGRR